jgi:hypothetical protein
MPQARLLHNVRKEHHGLWIPHSHTRRLASNTRTDPSSSSLFEETHHHAKQFCEDAAVAQETVQEIVRLSQPARQRRGVGVIVPRRRVWERSGGHCKAHHKVHTLLLLISLGRMKRHRREVPSDVVLPSYASCS